MVNPRRQVLNLVVFNLILVGVVLTTFRLDYMTYSKEVDVGLWKATYHFTHNGDPAFVRSTFDFIHDKFCLSTGKPLDKGDELAGIQSFCSVISDFKIIGLSFVLTCALSLMALVYVTVYLTALASQMECARSFSPGIAQVVAVVLYLSAISLLICLSSYFNLWAEAEIKSGFIALVFSFVLLIISTAYYFTLRRNVLTELHKKLNEANPLRTPLLQDKLGTPLAREKSIPPVLLREEIEKLKASAPPEEHPEDQLVSEHREGQ